MGLNSGDASETDMLGVLTVAASEVISKLKSSFLPILGLITFGMLACLAGTFSFSQPLLLALLPASEGALLLKLCKAVSWISAAVHADGWSCVSDSEDMSIFGELISGTLGECVARKVSLLLPAIEGETYGA